jgi:hypothetical protein
MPTTSAPNGFMPVHHRSGGTLRAQFYKDAITSGATGDLFRGAPVYFDANGKVTQATATTIIGGIFAGCEFTDPSTGQRRLHKYWPASQTATGGIDAWIWTDPNLVFEVQATGSLAQSSVNAQANLVSATAGDTRTGQSAAMLSTTLATDAVSDQFQIVDRSYAENNAWGDSFTRVLVVINEHQFRASRAVAV